MKKIHYTDRYLLNPYHPVTVFVIGAGGTGSQVATGLARISVALQALGHPGLHVTVFDPDTVTEANIGRQLFSGSELGLNKAVALVTRINRFFGFSWEAKGQRYPLKASADREEPALANIIVTCTDNIRSRMNLWRFLKKHREHTSNNERSPIYWMDFGNARTTGQVLIGNIRGKILQPVSNEYLPVPRMNVITEEEQQRVFGAFERLSNAAAKDGFGLGLSIVQRIVTMLGGTIQLKSEKGKGSRFTVEIPMQSAEELPERINKTQIHHNRTLHDIVAIDNDKVLLLMLKEMYAQEGIHCDTCTDVAELMEMIRRKEYSLLLTDLNMPDINGFELLELLRTSNVGNSRIIPIIVTTASGSCNREELLERGFSDCLLKPFSISELMEVSDKCAMKGKQNEKPDFSSLLSYGNESVMLDKLIAETEKEMQSVRDAEQRKDFQELDALTHHLHSSWEILRADQPLRELYKQLHGSAVPDYEALNNAVTAVLDKGSEIIRLAKEERRKYENG